MSAWHNILQVDPDYIHRQILPNETIDNIELRQICLDSFAGRFIFDFGNNILLKCFSRSKVLHRYSYLRNCYCSNCARLSSIFLFKLANRKNHWSSRRPLCFSIQRTPGCLFCSAQSYGFTRQVSSISWKSGTSNKCEHTVENSK